RKSLPEIADFDHESGLTKCKGLPILRRHCAPVAEPVDAADSKCFQPITNPL
ncbi:MAG: hypothetical protein ACI89F_000578, partial [Porticoccaceae bacterium]